MYKSHGETIRQCTNINNVMTKRTRQWTTDSSQYGFFAVLGLVEHVQDPHAHLGVFPHGQTAQRRDATEREVFVRVGGRLGRVVRPLALDAAAADADAFFHPFLDGRNDHKKRVDRKRRRRFTGHTMFNFTVHNIICHDDRCIYLGKHLKIFFIYYTFGAHDDGFRIGII